MSQVGNTILHRLLLVLLVLAPLPLGSNREWSWTLLSFLVAVITLVWVLRSFFRPQRVSTVLKLPVIVLFLIVPAWAWLQTVAWLPAGWQHPLWGMSAAVLGPLLAGAPMPGSISLSAQDSLMAAMRLLSYGLVFFLAFQFGRDRATALILTHSRGGFFSTLAGGLVLLWLLYKRQQFHSAKSTAVLGGTVLVAIHSLFDFSLQMPGIAVTYAAILGVAFAQSYASRTG